MSSRPLIKPFPAILNGNMATTIVSAVSVIDNLSMVSYSYSWAGTAPSGTISVQVSNDYTQNGQGVANNPNATWNTLPLSSTPTVSGNTGNGLIDIDMIGSYAIRTVYTPVSGTGTLQATVVAKVQ